MRPRMDLTVIDARAMGKAIAEFNARGRVRFLKNYDVSRSSKFYLIFEERLYDTKALVAAYKYATGKTLPYNKFGGGDQTRAVFDRLARGDSDFEVFEDRLGELRYLSNEYDRTPRAWRNLRELGFSKWIPLEKYSVLATGRLPGV